MLCQSCNASLAPKSVAMDTGDLPFLQCGACAYLWLAGEQVGRLQPDFDGDHEKAISDFSCPDCPATFLESARVRGYELTLSCCRKCAGMRVALDSNWNEQSMAPGSGPFGDFVAATALVSRLERQARKTVQLPATFHVENAQPTDLKCPCCATPLTCYHVRDDKKAAAGIFEICDECFGIWLDKDDLLGHGGSGAAATLEVDFETIKPSSRTCPECRDISLIAMQFREIATEIDCCPSCFGTWLDGGELHEFSERLGKDDHDVIDALVDNAVFRQPALCKMLRHFSRTLHELDAQVRSQSENLDQARDIQARLLFGNEQPRTLVNARWGAYEVVTFWQPARTVGGDYFDLIHFRQGEDEFLGICIADVSGKGMPAALLMANFQALLRSFAPTTFSPGELSTQLNAILHHNTPANKYITCVYGVLDLARHRFTFTNAGHNEPILCRPDGTEMLKTGGTMLGLFPKWTFTERTIDLAPGDRILFYTDGLSEIENPEGEQFEEERLTEILASGRDQTVAVVQNRILRAAKEFGHGHFLDDATALLLGRDGK